MAIWQYTFHIIPCFLSKNSEDYSVFQSLRDSGEDDYFWIKQNISPKIFHYIHHQLPRTQSWSSQIIQYGNLETSCLEIFVENDLICSVSLRVDYRCSYDNILILMFEICKTNDLLLLDENYSVLDYDLQNIKNIIEHSRSYNIYHRISGNEF